MIDDAFTPWAWPLLGSAAFQFGLGVYLRHRRQTRAAVPLALVLVVTAAWCIAAPGELAAQQVRVRLDPEAGSSYENQEQLDDSTSAAYATVTVLVPGGTNTARGDADLSPPDSGATRAATGRESDTRRVDRMNSMRMRYSGSRTGSTRSRGRVTLSG